MKAAYVLGEHLNMASVAQLMNLFSDPADSLDFINCSIEDWDDPGGHPGIRFMGCRFEGQVTQLATGIMSYGKPSKGKDPT